ncbi:hypothetical protein [Pseudolactococcus carnosus]|uniref:Uncharacterized protein n=1 Tax=Pseudolactococcus carnosus TaxID=2749961 RepID=A0ABT0AR58_9LACT|nr:hypothetical protein [Lactococcus carnosus]MCJ1989198.1 hypothetical protein [Lactococcus carnosus]
MKPVKNKIMIHFVAILSVVLLLDMFKSMVRDSTMVFNLSIVRDLWDTFMLYVILSNTIKKKFSKIYLLFLYGALYLVIRIGEKFSEIRLYIGSPINYILLLVTGGFVIHCLLSVWKSK